MALGHIIYCWSIIIASFICFCRRYHFTLLFTRIYVRLNLQYRIVLVASKAERRAVWHKRQLFGRGPLAAYHGNF